MNSMDSIARVLLVDDHPAMLVGLSALINREPDLAVCGTARSSSVALGCLKKSTVDIAVIDLSLGDACGLELMREIRAAGWSLPMLVYSCFSEPYHVRGALAAGANGFIAKDEIDNVVPALRTLLAGGRYFAPSVAGRIDEACLSPWECLSEQEQKIYKLLGQGHAIGEIAPLLSISPKTVYTYCQRMNAKLNLPDSHALRTSAVRDCNR